jgi:NADH-quinone oxidoreductase subunit J
MMPIFQDSEAILFWIIGGLTAGSAIMTLLSQNIVRSATWLLFTLGGTAGTFFLLGADFVGATQLLVYVGGTLILVVFGVMLTAQGPFITMKTSAAEWAISLTVGVALYATLAIAALNSGHPSNPPVVAEFTLKKEVKDKSGKEAKEVPARMVEVLPTGSDPVAKAQYTDVIGLGFLGQGVGPAHKEGDKIVRASYLLPFEIVSVHLLVVLIGAAYLARAKRRRGTT